MMFLLRLILTALAMPFAGILIFLSAAALGAILPASETSPGKPIAEAHTIEARLIVAPLHIDLALPVSADLRKRFRFLNDTDYPLDHPDLAYIGFGWGSEAFYTTAGRYSEIKAGAVWKAVTGDKAVIRFQPFAQLPKSDHIIPIRLSQDEQDRILSQLEEALKVTGRSGPHHLIGASLSEGDAFFHAAGRFNLFQPCNEWLREVFVRSGIQMGFWTPTRDAFLASLHWHGRIGEQPH